MKTTPHVANALMENLESRVLLSGGDEPDLVVFGAPDGIAPPQVIADGDHAPAREDGTRFGGKSPLHVVERAFTLHNPSDTELVITGVGLFTPGNGLPSFAFETDFDGPLTLEPGESRTLVISFTSTSPGAHAATVEIYSNDEGDPTYDFRIRGTVTPTDPTLEVLGAPTGILPVKFIADGDMSPRKRDGTRFGMKGPLQQLSNAFVLRNPSSSPLVISGVQVVSGKGGFTVAFDGPVTVSPHGFTTLSIEFNGTAPGVHFGTVEIMSNDPAHPVYDFRIRGTVQSHEPLPSTVIFGGPDGIKPVQFVMDGSTSPDRDNGTRFGKKIERYDLGHGFVLTNNSESALVVSEVRATGAPGAFDVRFDGPQTVEPGGFLTFAIDFVGRVPGVYVAHVEVVMSDPLIPVYDFRVRGTVVEEV